MVRPVTAVACYYKSPIASSAPLPKEKGWNLGRKYAVGMLFLEIRIDLGRSQSSHRHRRAGKETLTLVGWRDVPINTKVLGEIALATLPRIEQVFVNAPPGWVMKDLDRRLYIARRRIPAHSRRTVLYCQPLQSGHRLQRALSGRRSAAPLSGSGGYPSAIGDLRLPPAFLHQHSENRAGRWPNRSAPAYPQRRDQYHQWQPAVGAGPRLQIQLAAAAGSKALPVLPLIPIKLVDCLYCKSICFF